MLNSLLFIHCQISRHAFAPMMGLKRNLPSKSSVPFLSNWFLMKRPALAPFNRSLTALLRLLRSLRAASYRQCLSANRLTVSDRVLTFSAQVYRSYATRPQRQSQSARCPPLTFTYYRCLSNQRFIVRQECSVLCLSY